MNFDNFFISFSFSKPNISLHFKGFIASSEALIRLWGMLVMSAIYNCLAEIVWLILGYVIGYMFALWLSNLNAAQDNKNSEAQ